MPHVIFLNGPPRSGKDTVGRIITEVVGWPAARAHKFAHALKVGAHALFAAMQDRLADDAGGDECHLDDYYENSKATALPEFFGVTPRQVYIAVSELLCKPVFGKDFFGRIVADYIKQMAHVQVWAITDSGFAHEAEPVIRQVGRENCMLVRVHREGCTFAGDSRSYIDLDVPTKLDLQNNGTLDELRYLVRTAVLGKLS